MSRYALGHLCIDARKISLSRVVEIHEVYLGQGHHFVASVLCIEIVSGPFDLEPSEILTNRKRGGMA